MEFINIRLPSLEINKELIVEAIILVMEYDSTYFQISPGSSMIC